MIALTRWFSDEEAPPSLPGVYEVEPDHHSPWYSYWDGANWSWLTLGDKERAGITGTGCIYPSLTWRGLAEDPSKVQP